MKFNAVLKLTAVAGLALMLSTGCSAINNKESGQSIDPPPTEAESVMGDSIAVTAENGRQATLYFKDSMGLVAPVTMYIPKTVSIAKKSLEYMVDGGPGMAALPEGFQALLPQGTIVKGLDIKADQKLAVVDFSKEFNSYNAQDERKILEAVVWTLTGLDNVEHVSIRVEGQELKEMNVHNTPVDSQMGREMGINLELAGNLNVGRSVPVTLYFQNQGTTQTGEPYSYYVPVTRLVERTPDLAKAVVEELIKGPDLNKNLAAVMSADTGLLQVALSEDNSTVTVDFDNKLLGSDNKIPASAAQAVILSLTQTTGASKVQLMVNGDVKVAGTDNTDFAKPVQAPDYINPVKM